MKLGKGAGDHQEPLSRVGSYLHQNQHKCQNLRGVVRICCIELISFIQSLISFIRLLFSFAPTLVSFVRRLFSFAQTAADIDSWLLWIGGGGAWSWVWACGLVGGRGEGTGRGTGTPHLYLVILDLSSSWKAALLNSCRLDGLASVWVRPRLSCSGSSSGQVGDSCGYWI